MIFKILLFLLSCWIIYFKIWFLFLIYKNSFQWSWSLSSLPLYCSTSHIKWFLFSTNRCYNTKCCKWTSSTSSAGCDLFLRCTLYGNRFGKRSSDFTSNFPYWNRSYLTTLSWGLSYFVGLCSNSQRKVLVVYGTKWRLVEWVEWRVVLKSFVWEYDVLICSYYLRLIFFFFLSSFKRKWVLSLSRNTSR
jgi:hypothetical protein